MKFPLLLQPDPRAKVAPDGSVIDLMALDRSAKAFLANAPVVTATGDVDLSSYCIAMDQLNVNACAANATAEAEEMLSNMAGYKPTPVSRLFLYNLARNENGNLNLDNGTYVRSCFDVLSRFGVCDEYLWPYVQTNLFTLPSLMAMRQAAGHKISGYYRIFDTGDPQDRVNAVIAALRASHPVVFGTMIDAAFEVLGPNAGPIPPPADLPVGGHALVVVGWINGAFKVKNSWGTDWGDGGFCTFSTDYIASYLTSDLWVPTITVPLQ